MNNLAKIRGDRGWLFEQASQIHKLQQNSAIDSDLYISIQAIFRFYNLPMTKNNQKCYILLINWFLKVCFQFFDKKMALTMKNLSFMAEILL